jgi:hypothetical protein
MTIEAITRCAAYAQAFEDAVAPAARFDILASTNIALASILTRTQGVTEANGFTRVPVNGHAMIAGPAHKDGTIEALYDGAQMTIRPDGVIGVVATRLGIGRFPGKEGSVDEVAGIFHLAGSPSALALGQALRTVQTAKAMHAAKRAA